MDILYNWKLRIAKIDNNPDGYDDLIVWAHWIQTVRKPLTCLQLE
jgi:hypothetical protein